MMRLSKLIQAGLLALASFIGLATLYTPFASAAYNSNYLISDKIFRDTTTMSVADIQNFLNNKNSGLKDYHDVENCGSPAGTHYSYYATYYACGQSVLASKIIYDAGQAYGINPRVILATLQKEQSLVTTPNPTASQLNYAMGYGCPDSGGCSYPGFFNQVDNGTWQFRVDVELNTGNNYWGYTPSSYPCNGATRYYSTGLIPGRTVTFYDDYGTGYVTIPLQTAATAALYCYTPHVYPGSSQEYYSGSYWFVYYFEQWFGSVASPCYNDNNIPSVLSGRKVLKNNVGNKADNLTLNYLNNTGSACIELHTWGTNQQSWISNLATNHPVVNDADDEVVSGDYNGDGRTEFYLIKYRNSGSGKLEIHGWDGTNQQWAVHIATNHPEVDPADDRVVMADVNGDGHDEFLLIKYRHTGSGHIEVHTWAPGFQGWVSNIATNHPEVDPAHERIVPADINGDRIDELNLVKYDDGASGRIEIHTWLPGYQAWYSNIATNHPYVDPSNNAVIAANTTGDGKDRLILVKYYGGQSGKVEVHTWNPGYQSWMSNVATNYPAINW